MPLPGDVIHSNIQLEVFCRGCKRISVRCYDAGELYPAKVICAWCGRAVFIPRWSSVEMLNNREGTYTLNELLESVGGYHE
jgi:hypothetical protein